MPYVDRENDIEELTTKKINSAASGLQEEPSPRRLTKEYVIYQGRILPSSLEGYTSIEGEYPFLASRTECTPKQRCAQELFFHFILSIGTFMYENQVRVGGNTTLAPSNTMDAEASFKEELMSSKFHNSILDKIAVEVYNTNLCSSLEAAYHLIIPPLSLAGVLPKVGGVICNNAIQAFRKLVKTGEWLKAADIYDWVYNSMGKTFDCKSEEEVNAIAHFMNFATKLREEANSELPGSNRRKKLTERVEAMLKELTENSRSEDVVRAVGLMLESLQELDEEMAKGLNIHQKSKESDASDISSSTSGHQSVTTTGDDTSSENDASEILNFTSEHQSVATTGNDTTRENAFEIPGPTSGHQSIATTGDNTTKNAFEILGFTPGHQSVAATGDDTSRENLSFTPEHQSVAATGDDTDSANTDFSAEDAKSQDILRRLPLHYAAANPKLPKEKLKNIIKLTNDVNQRDIDDNTPLHFAASSGNVDFIELLQTDKRNLEVDFNAANILGRTPLHRAAAKGHTDMVDKLLTEGASVNLEDVSRRTALHHAALGGHLSVMKALLAKRANPAAVDINGRSPLHIAATSSAPNSAPNSTTDPAPDPAPNWIMVQELIKRGNDSLPMITDKDGKTALDLVIDKANQMLKPGSSPLEVQFSDLVYCIENLLATEEGRNKDWRALHYAASFGEKPTFEALLKLRLRNKDPENPLNEKDRDGATPLHIAAHAGHWELVEWLIENNYEHSQDLYDQDDNQEGALMLAVTHGQVDTVMRILKRMRELSPNEEDVVSKEKNTMGINPLHWVAAHGSHSLASTLVQLGRANPSTPDKQNMTALHYAALMGNVDVADYLLRVDLNLVDAIDVDGDTPLHCAAAGGRDEIVQLLFEKFQADDNHVLVRADRCDLNLDDYIKKPNTAGETALHCAARGIFCSRFKRRVILYNGTILQPGVFTKLDPITKAWHRNVLSKLLCPQDKDKITAEEFDGLFQQSWQWQDEFMKLMRRINGDYCSDRDPESNAEEAVVNLLLDHGADIEAVDNGRQTPLHLAARWGRLAIAEVLLERLPPADSSARDEHEDTPLHLAARWGYESIVNLLIKEGAHVEEENKFGQSPEEVAKTHLQLEIVDLLQKKRLQPEQRSPSLPSPSVVEEGASSQSVRSPEATSSDAIYPQYSDQTH